MKQNVSYFFIFNIEKILYLCYNYIYNRGVDHMRYSKAKVITAGIITFVCLLLVGFGIYKGIDYSRKLIENTDTKKDEKVLATVYKNTDTKKKTTTKKK